MRMLLLLLVEVGTVLCADLRDFVKDPIVVNLGSPSRAEELDEGVLPDEVRWQHADGGSVNTGYHRVIGSDNDHHGAVNTGYHRVIESDNDHHSALNNGYHQVIGSDSDHHGAVNSGQFHHIIAGNGDQLGTDVDNGAVNSGQEGDYRQHSVNPPEGMVYQALFSFVKEFPLLSNFFITPTEFLIIS